MMTATIPQLDDALQRHTLALFIGADLPRAVTGLPSRADIARELARRHRLDASPVLSLAQVAQMVSVGGNRYDFTDFIKRALTPSGASPQPFHRRIVELVQAHRIATIITTAYDDMLKWTFRQMDVPLHCVQDNNNVPFIEPNRPTLFQLYGEANRPTTLVVTEDDHYGLWRNRDKEGMLAEVRSVLQKNVVLLLGYNLADPDFRLLWREVLDRMDRFAMGAYAVWPGLSESDTQVWRGRGIVILDTDPLGILDKIVTPTVALNRPEATLTVAGEMEKPAWDTGLIRQLLTEAFDDQDLTALCYDHFHPVYEKFGSKMGKGEKTQRLLEYCTRQNQLDTLLKLVEANNPSQYAHFAPRLRREPSVVVPTLSKGDGESAPEQIYGAGNHWAVLAGVNEYQDATNYGNLQVCVKDVETVRKQLIAGGLDPARIRLLIDNTDELPTKANILVALKAIAEATEPDDLLLFYYSGHGDEAGGEPYLIARDGRRLVLGDTAVPVARVKTIMAEAPARAKVILLDACHSGADIGGKGPKPMSAGFIRRVFEQAEGLAILASCKQEQLSYEWRTQERSVFTHFLLEALAGQADRDEKGFVTVQDASRHVVNGVKLWASQHDASQTPTLQCTVAGDIILARYRA